MKPEGGSAAGADFMLILTGSPAETGAGAVAIQALSEPRLQRAIGVTYWLETEWASHYFHARLPSSSTRCSLRRDVRRAGFSLRERVQICGISGFGGFSRGRSDRAGLCPGQNLGLQLEEER